MKYLAFLSLAIIPIAVNAQPLGTPMIGSGYVSATALACGDPEPMQCYLPRPEVTAGSRDSTSGHTWHVLSVAENGTVTLLKGLTKHEADYAAARLQGLPATPAEVKQQADDKAAEELAVKVAIIREDDVLRAKSTPCPKEGDPDYKDPAWKKLLDEQTKEYGIKLSDAHWAHACHDKDGTVRRLGDVYVGIEYQGSGDTLIPQERPWVRHANMKLVEVFQ